ncbi:MAG: YebC/PmpR family DNA-binding transcriptional regulator [Bdellovibrionales bacterium]|nr:YebC/PmpR family DNA-binding transcriptional regulator [Bdellovibrionales bacterium]
MGKGWKKASMLEASQKKGKIFTKLAREIYIATKLGGPDPEGNPRLKLAIRSAMDVSCPKTTIERAIKKGSGQLDDDTIIEEVLYEGLGPHNVGIMVECLTDNRNRSVSEIRAIFKKNGGQMGDQGSAAWQFDRVALIEGTKVEVSDPEEDAIEVGANEVEKSDEENQYSFYGNPEDLDQIRSQLLERGWDVTTAELYYKPKNVTELNEEQLKEVETLLEALDDNDDSNRIYTTL